MYKLTSENVDKVIRDCFFTPEEINDPKIMAMAVPVEGLTMKVAFHPVRLKENEVKVVELLTQLDPKFYIKEMGGWSFLNMPFDADGNQWGEQFDAQSLLFLGLALGLGKYAVPRSMWPSLYGGVPYVIFNLSRRVPEDRPPKVYLQ